MSRLRRMIPSGQRPQSPATAETLDLSDASVAADPFPRYEELRRGGSVHFLPRQGFWLVLGYEEVHRALTQPQLFSNRAPEWKAVDSVLLGADPPEHTAARRAVVHLFSAEVLEALAGFAERTAEELLRPLAAGRSLEVLREFASPLSEEVSARLIGFDEATLAALRATQGAAKDQGGWLAALDSVIAENAGLIPFYGRLQRDGELGLSAAQTRSLIRFLWIAGITTTRRAISSAVLSMLRHPAERGRVGSDPRLLPAFVEESLRLHPPEHTVSRVTAVEVELSGVRIPAGAPVRLCIGAANRDPAQFADPASFLLPRTPNRHLSFGAGVHRCVGAALARTEVAAALRVLLRVAPHFRPVEPLASLPHAGFTSDTVRLLIER